MKATPQSPSLINDFADFLSCEPKRDQIVSWRPTRAVERRYQELVEQRRSGKIGAGELQELEAFLNSEIVLSLLRARMRTNTESTAGQDNCGSCD